MYNHTTVTRLFAVLSAGLLAGGCGESVAPEHRNAWSPTNAQGPTLGMYRPFTVRALPSITGLLITGI